MLKDCSSLSVLSVSLTMENLASTACTGVGTEENPCLLIVPEGFNFPSDTDPDETPFTWCSGYFTLGHKYEMGDVNMDGHVTVTDVMLTVNHILGNEPERFHKKYADMNSDTNINVADVMLIVSKVINQ